jgi:hypothetical protein
MTNEEKLEIYQKHTDEIMDNFDFSKVQKVMELIDWKWGIHPNNYVPNEAELRSSARSLIKNCIKALSEFNTDRAFSACGGFVVEVFEIPDDFDLDEDSAIALTFELESWGRY